MQCSLPVPHGTSFTSLLPLNEKEGRTRSINASPLLGRAFHVWVSFTFSCRWGNHSATNILAHCCCKTAALLLLLLNSKRIFQSDTGQDFSVAGAEKVAGLTTQILGTTLPLLQLKLYEGNMPY
jgi:hypothetical protein